MALSAAGLLSAALLLGPAGGAVSRARVLSSPGGALGYQNPVYPLPFPDPMVLDVGGRHRNYYAYGTGRDFPILHSADLVRWRPVGTALARRPRWVPATGNWRPWSPSVLQTARPCPGSSRGPCFVMYYSAHSAAWGVNCIGVATARGPGGPFTGRGILNRIGQRRSEPAGCGDPTGHGNIDPSPFVDRDGRAYLYVSTGTACHRAATRAHCPWRPTISVLPLAADVLHASGHRVALFAGTPHTWEQAPWAPVVEGPSVVWRDGTYFLFFSGGAYNGRYGMGYAVGYSPLGPFRQARSNPVLADTARVLSVGGGSLVTGPKGAWWLVYAGRSDRLGAPRLLRIDAVRWRGGRPLVTGPSVTPQPGSP